MFDGASDVAHDDERGKKDTMRYIEFHLPVRPYSPIDALNRVAAAKGSPCYAESTAHADYNGHHVTLTWNEYRRYYVAEYFWAGRVVLSRGDFAACLRAVLDEYARGALGASASIVIPADDTAALKIARNDPSLISGPLCFANQCAWWSWRHDVGAESARDMANPGRCVLIFDWNLCQSAESRDAYEQALRAKYGREYQ